MIDLSCLSLSPCNRELPKANDVALLLRVPVHLQRPPL